MLNLMQKKKPGRKPLGEKKKIQTTITIDRELPGEVAKVTPNLSGFLNDAGWEKLRRAKKVPGHFRDTKGKSA